MGCITKWVLDLSEYHIDFQPRKQKQAQILANFVVENMLLSPVTESHNPETLDPRKAWPYMLMGPRDKNLEELGSF